MRRLLVPVALLLATAIVGGGIGLVLRARGGAPAEESPARSSLSVVGAAVRPPVQAFGDPVVAEVVLVGNSAVVRPDSIQIRPDFSPYEAAGPVQIERLSAGSTVRWRFRWPLTCLREGCAPDGPRRTFEFPLTNVTYRFRTSPGPASAILDWPPFEVTGRVGSGALAARAWRADVTSLPPVTHRLGPGLLAAALLGGSALFAALGSALVWWFARGRRPEDDDLAREVQVARVSPLERALELAREAARNGDSPERRKALERVARELGERGLPSLADRARALAWSPGPPSAGAVDQLAREADAAANGARP